MSNPTLSLAAVFCSLSVALAGCGGAEPLTVETDAGVVEEPELNTRGFCTGDDLANCKVCVDGIMQSICPSGQFCYNGTCKVSTKAAGSACTAANQCATDFCTDGVCCTVSACSGGCSFCGAGGTCAPRTGVAPKSCSLSTLGGTCGAPGCYGESNCGYPKSTTSCSVACVSSGSGFSYGGTGSCNGAGACGSVVGATSCGNYTCTSSGCKTSCTTNSDCLSTAYCDGGTCKAKVSTGSSCTSDASCAAGAGSCKPTPEGNRCCTASCTAPQVCNTAGNACVGTLPIGESCTSGSVCATGKCHSSGKCSECLGDSDCSAADYCDATAFKCVPRAGTGSSCTSSASCPSGLFCTEGVCCESADCGAGSTCAGTNKGKCAKKNATTCSSGAECDSGNCIDGVCCDSACTGKCEACDVPGSVGKCVAVKGLPHGSRDACPGTEVEVCARATCDGATRDACTGFTSSDTECRAASCSAGVATAPATCTGTGSCPAVITAPCGGYACDAAGKACRTSCETNADCTGDYVCKANRCEPKTSTCSEDRTTSVSREGTPKPCAPYRCDTSSGNCFSGCTATDQCAAGFACDGTQCVAVPAPTEDDASGCAMSTTSVRGSGVAVVALLGALAALSRRSRSRGSANRPHA